MRSCTLPVGAAKGREVVTIEGLNDAVGAAVRRAWIEESVPQCGYCQAGQIMSAVVLLREHPSPSEAAIVRAMEGNLCRCGTYRGILRAVEAAAANGEVG